MVGYTNEARAAAIVANRIRMQRELDQRIANYNSSPTLCKACKKALPYEKRTGEYCNRSCANSGIMYTEERKLKIAKSLRQRTNYGPPKPRILVCESCGNEFKTLNQSKTCSKECRKNITSIKSVSTRRENNSFPGWHNRRGESSYPELYFESVFNNENITGWEREKKVGRWFIDFAFNDKKLAVEIDGAQHKLQDRKESDEIKDAFLISQGWQIIRIPWYNPRNQKGKDLLYPLIKELLVKLK